AGLTSIKTFNDRLDEILPRTDLSSGQWAIGAREASVHFAFLDGSPGASIYFAKLDGRWKIDAGKSVDVVLHGLSNDQTLAAFQDPSEDGKAGVLDRMFWMEQVFRRVTSKIRDGQLTDLAQVRQELQAADERSPGRAFFRLALRYDDADGIRTWPVPAAR